jgi:hypothetical protein
LDLNRVVLQRLTLVRQERHRVADQREDARQLAGRAHLVDRVLVVCITRNSIISSERRSNYENALTIVPQDRLCLVEPHRVRAVRLAQIEVQALQITQLLSAAAPNSSQSSIRTYILDGEPLEFIDQCQADRNVEQEGDPEQRREDRLDVECALRA